MVLGDLEDSVINLASSLTTKLTRSRSDQTENKGKRVPRSKQARIGAVSVAGSETASVASTEDSVDAALFGEEGEAEEVPVVDEDVFMTDYTIFKDEDDDAANVAQPLRFLRPPVPLLIPSHLPVP
ncbi:hypothetical protein B0H14DRAFT_2579229 [Mycena olivaceomarginata]|nr:hypothetical protein B0H14DRAFT_2579229 [Mycena olivaceomarginata]